MAKLQITYRKASDLVPRPTNPRTHSPKQLAQIAASIRHFGFTNPVLIDEEGGIIAGHGRVAAAKLIGMEEVPTVCLTEMSEADIRAYVIADNKLAENAGWDRKLLGLELHYIEELGVDLAPTITGCEPAEIDVLVGEVTIVDEQDDPADAPVALPEGPTVTRAGDIWRIGPHRLICGDSTKAETYAALLGESRAQMVFCDPPFNVPVSGHICGLGTTQHREFAMASGEMSEDEFTQFLATVFGHLSTFSIDGAIHYQCMDWRHMSEMLAAGEVAYTELKNLCVWAKSNGGMGSLYRSQHELVFVYKSGSAPHINNVALGKHGRYRTNLWSYPGVNSFGHSRSDLELHPTVKPIALVMDAIRDCSRRGGIVLDAFAGSGTTLIAAERTGRRGFGIEIDPIYCDTIIARMKALFGLEAVLETTEQSFAEVQAERSCQFEEAVS